MNVQVNECSSSNTLQLFNFSIVLPTTCNYFVCLFTFWGSFSALQCKSYEGRDHVGPVHHCMPSNWSSINVCRINERQLRCNPIQQPSTSNSPFSESFQHLDSVQAFRIICFRTKFRFLYTQNNISSHFANHIPRS